MSQRDQIKICREEWFKDHKAALLLGQATLPWAGTTIIEWKKPASWNYGCRFIIHSQWLTVVGDIGEAVYQWGQTIDLPFLASLNFDYFMGKCRASEVGTRFRQWCPRTAVESLQRHLAECSNEEKKFIEDITVGTPKDEFDHLLNEGVARGDLEYDFAGSISECGYIPNCRCVGHYVGLQMAIEQLTPPTA